jgi:hypothetical protein
VRLLRIVVNVPDGRPAIAGLHGGHSTAVPVAEQCVDVADEIIPIDPSRHGDDHVARADVGADERADVVDRDPLDIRRHPLGGHAPWMGVVELAEG